MRGKTVVMESALLARLIRTVPDWPKPGILFYDITTLLADARGFHQLIEEMSGHWRGHRIDAVVGIEARGFIIGPALALNLGAGFVPVRKPAKLPWATEHITYELEYGTDTLHIHADAVRPEMNVLVCDDLLATGGTARATIDLCQRLGATVIGAAFAVELTALNGRSRLRGVDVQSVITFQD